MAEVEEAIPLPDILKMLGWSERKYYRHRPELIRYGVIFKRREGTPWRRRVYAFPSRIHKYVALKSQNGQDL